MLHIFALLGFFFFCVFLCGNIHHVCTLPQALRVSDHYPVEVELRKAPPFWEVSSYQRRDSVDTQRASDNRAVTGEEQNCNLLFPCLR